MYSTIVRPALSQEVNVVTTSGSHYVLHEGTLTITRPPHHHLGVSSTHEGVTFAGIDSTGGLVFLDSEGHDLYRSTAPKPGAGRVLMVAMLRADLPAKTGAVRHIAENTPFRFVTDTGVSLPLISNRCHCGDLVDLSQVGAFAITRVNGDSENGYEALHSRCC